MKSKGDPLQALCQEKPHTEADLKTAYETLGWGPPFSAVDGAAIGTYIVKGDDGLYRLRAPERRKRPRARLEVSTTPEGAARLLALAGSTIAGLKVLDVEPKR